MVDVLIIVIIIMIIIIMIIMIMIKTANETCWKDIPNEDLGVICIF